MRAYQKMWGNNLKAQWRADRSGKPGVTLAAVANPASGYENSKRTAATDKANMLQTPPAVTRTCNG
jgi:hypothetical protein